MAQQHKKSLFNTPVVIRYFDKSEFYVACLCSLCGYLDSQPAVDRVPGSVCPQSWETVSMGHVFSVMARLSACSSATCCSCTKQTLFPHGRKIDSLSLCFDLA
ncbi:hypothetical protein NQZ68_027432 [Dissostichus eleginoides]|nr:hypothetical protein NQZ68_027432 [Dissostichus eleginoides]